MLKTNEKFKKLVLCGIKVVSGEKEGGLEVVSIDAYPNTMGSLRWTSILYLIGQFYLKKLICFSSIVHVIH